MEAKNTAKFVEWQQQKISWVSRQLSHLFDAPKFPVTFDIYTNVPREIALKTFFAVE